MHEHRLASQPDCAAPSPLAHLRPCTSMEMLDRTTAVLRSRWKLLLPLGLLYALPESLALMAIVAAVEWTGNTGLTDSLATVLLAAWLLSQWPNAAIIIVSINGFIFADRHANLWASLRHALPRLPYLILTRLYIMFTLVLLLLPSLTIIMPSGPGTDGTVPVFLLAVAGLVAAALLAIFCILTPPIIMVEQKAFFRAMGRSILLMRASFRRGIPGDRPALRLLLLLVIPAVAYAGTQAVVNIMSYQIAGEPALSLDYHPLVLLAMAALLLPARLVSGLWLYTGICMLYLECRMRTEGFDLAVRLQARTRSAPQAPVWAEPRE